VYWDIAVRIKNTDFTCRYALRVLSSFFFYIRLDDFEPDEHFLNLFFIQFHHEPRFFVIVIEGRYAG
jgi:hypothetical protein